MKHLNRYLAYGDTYEIEMRSPVPVVKYDWSELKDTFKQKLHDSLLKIDSNHLSFCGTTSGLIMRELLKEKDPTLWIFDGINIDEIVEKNRHFYAKFDVKNIEKDLIEINEISASPRCSMEDLYAFHRQRCIRQETDIVYCEGGTDFLFLGFNVVRFIMASLFRKKQYSMPDAMKYLNGDIRVTEVASYNARQYYDKFHGGFFYFTNIRGFMIDSDIENHPYNPPDLG